MPSQDRGVPTQNRDWGAHPKDAPRPLRATLQDSYHRILRGLQARGDDTGAPPLIFGGVLEEGAYPLARRLLRGRMIEIVRSHAPNKVLMSTPPPLLMFLLLLHL